MWEFDEELCLLDPRFPRFKEDLVKLRKLGIIIGNHEGYCISPEFMNKLVKYIKEHPDNFLEYDLTQPMLVGVNEILTDYNIINNIELKRMLLIMASWIDGVLKGGGFYDLN